MSKLPTILASISVGGCFLFAALSVELYAISHVLGIICMVLAALCFISLGLCGIVYMIADNKEKQIKKQYYDRL